MSKEILGSAVVIVGILATAFGIFGGVFAMFQKLDKAQTKEGRVALPADFVKALTEFLNALAKSPIWLALMIVGMALIGLGGSFF